MSILTYLALITGTIMAFANLPQLIRYLKENQAKTYL